MIEQPPLLTCGPFTHGVACGGSWPIEADLALAETEQETREILLAAGRTIPDAARDLTPDEIRAGVEFATLDKQHARAVAAMIDAQRPVVAGTIDMLETLLRQVAHPVAVTMLLDATNPATTATALTRLLPLIDTATALINETLLHLANTTAAGVISEAIAQRARNVPLTVDLGALNEPLGAWARRVAAWPVPRLLNAATDAVMSADPQTPGPALSRRAGEAMRALSDAAARDVASQGAGGAQGMARLEAAAALPDPHRVIASELLDRNTCGPCAVVDGREYRTLADARRDYPAGHFIDCEGGARCRGTLVFIHESEAPATV